MLTRESLTSVSNFIDDKKVISSVMSAQPGGCLRHRGNGFGFMRFVKFALLFKKQSGVNQNLKMLTCATGNIVHFYVANIQNFISVDKTYRYLYRCQYVWSEQIISGYTKIICLLYIGHCRVTVCYFSRLQKKFSNIYFIFTALKYLKNAIELACSIGLGKMNAPNLLT